MTKYIITGNKGFIGTHMCNLLAEKGDIFYGIDANLAGSNCFETGGTKNCQKQYTYNLCDLNLYEEIKSDFNNDFKDVIVINYAAFSHVDLSIKTPISLVTQNIQSTYTIAEFCAKNNIPFVNIGTDEIFGELTIDEPPFSSFSPLHPRNPYSASKACSEVLLESLVAQYPNWKLLRTRCVNNFGEYQDYTKLIPVCISNILNNRPIPVYGQGKQIRSWIDAKVHNEVVYRLIQKSFVNSKCVLDLRASRCYNIGSIYELSNISLISEICNIMNVDVNSVVQFISDPRGNAHDFRYSLDSRSTEHYLSYNFTGFDFKSRLQQVIEWYKNNLSNKEQMWKGSSNV